MVSNTYRNLLVCILERPNRDPAQREGRGLRHRLEEDGAVGQGIAVAALLAYNGLSPGQYPLDI